MESLERLREFVSRGSRTQITTLPPIDQVTLDWRDLTKLIDAVEEEFKEQEQAHNFAISQIYDFASGIYGQLLDFDKMEEQQNAMAEHGWVKLPVDADGVPIRVGDVLNPPADCDDYQPLMVMRLTYDGYENEWFFDGEAGGFTGMVGEHMDVAGWTHHHEPTVEDVLRELLDEAEHFHSLEEAQDAIAEYAQRLRLAGDE